MMLAIIQMLSLSSSKIFDSRRECNREVMETSHTREKTLMFGEIKRRQQTHAGMKREKQDVKNNREREDIYRIWGVGVSGG